VTTGLGTWHAHGYLLYLVALLPLSLFFRFDVLVTVHLYDLDNPDRAFEEGAARQRHS
jgi:hypothetical protein